MTKTEGATWTIAYRKPRANRFLRIGSWSGTWTQANALAGLFAEANPELEVYYTSSHAAEVAGRVVEEDRGNILVSSGKRVRIVDDIVTKLPAEMLARIPSAEIADARRAAGEPIADPDLAAATEAHAAAAEQVRAWAARHWLNVDATERQLRDAFAADHDEAIELDAEREIQAITGSIKIDGRPADVTAILERAELEMSAVACLELVRQAKALDEQLRPAEFAGAHVYRGPGPCRFEDCGAGPQSPVHIVAPAALAEAHAAALAEDADRGIIGMWVTLPGGDRGVVEGVDRTRGRLAVVKTIRLGRLTTSPLNLSPITDPGIITCLRGALACLSR
jgi:predicted nucleic acid-binding protein